MKLNNKIATDLTSKDRNIALNAARHIIDNKDVQNFVNKMYEITKK